MMILAYNQERNPTLKPIFKTSKPSLSISAEHDMIDEHIRHTRIIVYFCQISIIYKNT